MKDEPIGYRETTLGDRQAIKNRASANYHIRIRLLLPYLRDLERAEAELDEEKEAFEQFVVGHHEPETEMLEQQIEVLEETLKSLCGWKDEDIQNLYAEKK